jgi:hypothetical protein
LSDRTEISLGFAAIDQSSSSNPNVQTAGTGFQPVPGRSFVHALVKPLANQDLSRTPPKSLPMNSPMAPRDRPMLLCSLQVNNILSPILPGVHGPTRYIASASSLSLGPQGDSFDNPAGSTDNHLDTE